MTQPLSIADALVENADRLVALAKKRVAEAERDLRGAEDHAARMRERRAARHAASEEPA
jgi:hypothetical protein